MPRTAQETPRRFAESGPGKVAGKHTKVLVICEDLIYSLALSPILNIIRSTASLLLLTSTVVSSTTPPAVLDKIVLYANTYNVDFVSLYKTIECESSFDPDLQSAVIDQKGRREPSYGLAQIDLDYHPEVTIKQAKDPDFALDYIASRFAKGQQNQWTCYTILKQKNKL